MYYKEDGSWGHGFVVCKVAVCLRLENGSYISR